MITRRGRSGGMMTPGILGMAWVVALTLLCGPPTAATETGTPPAASFAPGEVLVKLKPGPGNRADALHGSIGASAVKTLRRSRVSRILLPGDMTVEEAVRYYRQNPMVEFVEPNYIIHLFNTYPDDQRFQDQWYHENTGQFGGVPDADIDAVEAWDISAGDPSVVVAVIDSGVDYNHPDLAANIWTNPGEDPWTDPTNPRTGNKVDDDHNGYVDDWKGYDFNGPLPLIPFPDNNPRDGVGHGTHLAGIIAAVGDNGIGVTGVAWNAKVMPLKIGPETGELMTVFVAAEAIDYAVANGAKIINTSWGGMVGINTIRTAIENANEQGVLFVAAAGNISNDNDGPFKFFPANFDIENVISVAATDYLEELAGFSNYGNRTVDVGAPGVRMLSTMPTYKVYLTRDPYNYEMNYDYLQGTSMAAPCVAGALAVLMAAHPGEGHLQIRDRLFAGVDQVPSLQGKTVTGGRINLNNSIRGSYPNYPDDEGDGVPNWTDNCRTRYNPLQEDTDEDGRGNTCDLFPTNPRCGTMVLATPGSTPDLLANLGLYLLPALYMLSIRRRRLSR